MPAAPVIRFPIDAARVRSHLAAKIRLVEPMAHAARDPIDRARLQAIVDTYCELYRDLAGEYAGSRQRAPGEREQQQ